MDNPQFYYTYLAVISLVITAAAITKMPISKAIIGLLIVTAFMFFPLLSKSLYSDEERRDTLDVSSIPAPTAKENNSDANPMDLQVVVEE